MALLPVGNAQTVPAVAHLSSISLRLIDPYIQRQSGCAQPPDRTDQRVRRHDMITLGRDQRPLRIQSWARRARANWKGDPGELLRRAEGFDAGAAGGPFLEELRGGGGAAPRGSGPRPGQARPGEARQRGD